MTDRLYKKLTHRFAIPVPDDLAIKLQWEAAHPGYLYEKDFKRINEKERREYERNLYNRIKQGDFGE